MRKQSHIYGPIMSFQINWRALTKNPGKIMTIIFNVHNRMWSSNKQMKSSLKASCGHLLSTQIGYFNGICGENFWNSCIFVAPKAPRVLVCLCSGRLKVVYWLWSISFPNIGGECLRLEWLPYSWELSKSTEHNFYKEVLWKWPTSIIKLSMKLSVSFSNLPFLQRVSIL